MKKQLLNLPSSSSENFSFYRDDNKQIFFVLYDGLEYPITGDSNLITKLKGVDISNKISLKEYGYSVKNPSDLSDGFEKNSIRAMEGIGDD